MFVRRRAASFTHFQNSMHQYGYIDKISSQLQVKSTRWPLLDKITNPDLKKILITDLEYIAALDTIILDLDKTLLEKARHHNRKHLEALQTIAGCGFSTSLTVLYETHTVDRFKTPQCYSSYCRVIGAKNESAGKNLGNTANTNIGNPHLKWAFSEIAIGMIKNYPEVKEWFDKQITLYGKPKAHARLRHKIAITVYYMLKNSTVFDMDKFLGITGSRVESHPQQWTETSGQQSEPNKKHDSPPGLSKTIKVSIKKRIRGGNPVAQLADAMS